jgi:hypothetical protein
MRWYDECWEDVVGCSHAKGVDQEDENINIEWNGWCKVMEGSNVKERKLDSPVPFPPPTPQDGPAHYYIKFKLLHPSKRERLLP